MYTPVLKEWSVRKLAVVHKALKVTVLERQRIMATSYKTIRN